jgi:RHS repeat-associated protein
LVPSVTGKVVADAVRLVRDNAADTDTEARAFAYSYDVNGNLTGINDTSSGARADDYQVTYTGLNQVESVTESLTGQETTTTTDYAYDVLGQPVTVDHPDQASEYTYADPRHLLTQVSVDDVNDTAGAKVTGYTYDSRGMRETETKANGNVVTNGYFLDGALKSLREEKSGGALVASHTYTYDDNGNKHTDVASKANADVAGAFLESTTTYSYDPVDRLAESVKTGNGAKTETYVHDDNANVISQSVGSKATTYSYDRNRLLTATTGTATASYRYDPFGRQTSVVSSGLTISRTTYDGFDHIAQSEQMNDAGALESTTYAYDPLDRTASKTAGGETTDYTYLGLSSEVLGEEVAGELTKSYQYSPWGQRLSQITHQGDPDAGVEAGESAYYGYNAHTDVETLTDGTGNAVATYGYTAYGSADESEYTGIDKPEAGTPEEAEPYNAYRYNSKRWDAASGTYDMGFRDYAPALNRFTTRDMYNGALADMGLGTDPYTSNRYAFTAGNPISGIELDGHTWSMDGTCSNCGRGPTSLFPGSRCGYCYFDQFNSAHDTATQNVYMHLMASQPMGGGFATMDLTASGGLRSPYNTILGGSSRNPGINDGYADLMYWTENSVYVWDAKHAGGDAERKGPMEVQNKVLALQAQLDRVGIDKTARPGFSFPSSEGTNFRKPNEIVYSRPSRFSSSVIAYSTMTRPGPEPEPVREPETVQVPELDPVATGLAVGGAILLGVISMLNPANVATS